MMEFDAINVIQGHFYVFSAKGIERLKDQCVYEQNRPKQTDNGENYIQQIDLDEPQPWGQDQGVAIPFTIRCFDLQGRGPRGGDLSEIPIRIITRVNTGDGDVRATWFPYRVGRLVQEYQDEKVWTR